MGGDADSDYQALRRAVTVRGSRRASSRAIVSVMPKSAPKPDDPAQSKRFIEMAAEVGADGKPEAFERAFRKVASAPREVPTPKARKTRAKR